jgi:gas vesicle protein
MDDSWADIRCSGNDTSGARARKQSLADSGQTCHNCNEGSMNTTSKESKEIDAKVDLLSKTASFYQRSIANYEEFVKTEAKPRKKKQLEQRLETILKEIEALTKTG